MTFGSIMAQFGHKDVAERLSDYHNTPVHDQHLYYSHEPPVHYHSQQHATPKHHHGGGGKKNNAALSALTLLAFLFFLNILQQCLRDQVLANNNPQITIMSAREGYENLEIIPESKKFDKSGQNAAVIQTASITEHDDSKSLQHSRDTAFTRVDTVQSKPNKQMSAFIKQRHTFSQSRNASVYNPRNIFLNNT